MGLMGNSNNMVKLFLTDNGITPKIEGFSTDRAINVVATGDFLKKKIKTTHDE